MDLLDIALPKLWLALDVDASTFFDRCEAIGHAHGWKIDRRRAYAGPGFDQLNLHIGGDPSGYPMLRMVVTPRALRRLNVDVVAHWKRHPIDYDEYLTVARRGYSALLAAYKAAHHKRYRLGIPKRPESINLAKIDYGRLGYAAEKFDGLTRSLAVGKGDARERLISAFYSIHTVQPDDLPPPLRKHLTWVYSEITKRPARHRDEGTVQATVSTMKNATAAKVLERLVDLADAIAAIEAHCRGPRGGPAGPGGRGRATTSIDIESNSAEMTP